MGRIVFIAFVHCCFIQLSFSQNLKYSIRNYSAVDGLPQSQITDLKEDKHGYLWFGTQGGGLARFDGHGFKVYTTQDGLLQNEIHELLFDKKQNLWVVSPLGVSRFNGLQFKKFKIPDSIVSIQRIRKVYALKDTIFLLSSVGRLSKIYQDSVLYWNKAIAKDKLIRLAHVAPSGEVCLFLDDGTVIVQSETKKEFSFSVNISKIYNAFNVKNDVVIHTDSGLYKLDFKNKEISKLPWAIDEQILLYDNARNIFWTTDGNNLFKKTINVDKVESDTVLHEVSMYKVFIDAENNTWFGSNGYGLYKYFIQDFDRITPKHINGVMSVIKDNEGAMWCGSMTKGIWKISNGKIKSYIDANAPERNSVYSIAQTGDGTIWAGTRYGIGKYNKQTDGFKWYVNEEGLASYAIIAIEADDHGGLWIGTRQGLSYFKDEKFTTYDLNEDKNVKTACWAIHYSKKYQTLFIGSDMKMLSLTNGKVKNISIPSLNSITSINAYHDSLLVISTGGVGIAILNPRTGANYFLNSRDGLASDFNYFITEDECSNLWIGSEKGINKIKLNTKNEIIENLHFGFDNGLFGIETNQNSFFFEGNDKYFGLVDGVYKYNNLSKNTKKSFDLHLTDVSVLYGEYDARQYANRLQGFFKIPINPIFPPDRNHITFNFNRVDKRYPNSVKFKYTLENFDIKWSLPSSLDQVTYGNLPPGDYTFKVMATNNTGSWSTKIAYPFTIRAPFYQRASFIVGMLILTVGLVTLILYMRVKQRINKAVQVERIRVKEQELLRKEIARDFHDEMGNQLTRIINYVSLLKLDGTDGSNKSELYGKVETSAKYLYNGTRDFIWAIDPVNDELSRLFIHIRDFGEKLFEEKNISFRAFNELKNKVKLPYGFSREANLIFKEAMTNAFKYSEAKNISFSLKLNGDEYEMILEDDGVGFCTNYLDKSNGLKNIRERADRINGQLRIKSEMNIGTTIILNFKLTKTLQHGFTF